MDKRSLLWTVLAVVAVVGIVAGSRWLGDRNERQLGEKPDVGIDVSSDKAEAVRVETPSLSEALGVDESEFVEVGGVKRPKRDVAFNEAKEEPVSTKSPFTHPGQTPVVPKDANPDVAGLHAELTQEKPNPAAVSSLFAPEPFDRTEYEADKKAWLSKIRPGRAFQPAQPGPDVKPIKSRTGTMQQLVQGEKVMFEVEASPGSPVTFHTPQIGEFGNRLTTQTVEASAEGIATATYTATSGTQGIVDILAASPVNSGQLRYRIRVSLPESN